MESSFSDNVSHLRFDLARCCILKTKVFTDKRKRKGLGSDRKRKH